MARTKFFLQLMQPDDVADAKIWYFGGCFNMVSHNEARVVDSLLSAVAFPSREEAQKELALINMPMLTVVSKEIIYN